MSRPRSPQTAEEGERGEMEVDTGRMSRGLGVKCNDRLGKPTQCCNFNQLSGGSVKMKVGWQEDGQAVCVCVCVAMG